MVALSLVASNGFPPTPALGLHHGHVITRTVQDLQPLFSTIGSRPAIVRSSPLSLTPYEHDDLFRSTTEFYEYCKFVKTASIRRMPLSQDFPHSVLFGSSVDERWAMYQQIVQIPLSRLNGLKEESLEAEHCLLPDLMFLLKSDLHLQHIASTDFELNRFFVEKASLIQEADCDLLHHLPSNISLHRDGQLPFVDNMVDIMDQPPLSAEQILTKDVYLWEQQKILVPHFRWKEAIDLNHLCPSSLELEAVISAPLKSPEQAKPKQHQKRKNKKAVRARDVYKTNTLHPCETLLSMMMDNTRNGKSVLSSVKKSGPELPQFLTQCSASIAGAGLAVIFSVLYKAASGTAPFCPSSMVTTSGFGIALFWLSWAVNRLRSTIVYIGKNSAKKGFQDREEEMVKRVDKNVKDVLFRAGASMAMLMLRFA